MNISPPRVLAQVTAVGYLNTTVPPGFSLIGAPLITGDSRVGALFTKNQDLPDGFAVFLLEQAGYEKITFNGATRQFEPEELASRELRPGQGAFVFNPTQADLLITFAGEIPQGILTNSIPAGFSLISSMVLREATPEELGFPAEPGDYIYYFDWRKQNFDLSVYDELEDSWMPPLRKINAGEAVIVRKTRPADWVQHFSLDGFAGEAVTGQAGDSSDQTFRWSEFFAPFPMIPGDRLALSFEIIPAGQALEVSVLEATGDPFMVLDFQNGSVNGTAPSTEGRWNQVQAVANLDLLSYELIVNGASAGSFPLGLAASGPAPSVAEFRLHITGFPGVRSSAWIDNIRLDLEKVPPMNFLDIDFDRTSPRYDTDLGTLRKEPRP